MIEPRYAMLCFSVIEHAGGFVISRTTKEHGRPTRTIYFAGLDDVGLSKWTDKIEGALHYPTRCEVNGGMELPIDLRHVEAVPYQGGHYHGRHADGGRAHIPESRYASQSPYGPA